MIWKDWFGIWLVALVALFCNGRALVAQEAFESESEIASLDAKVGTFLEAVSGGTIRLAYEGLLERSPLLASQQEAVDDLIARTEELEQRYGPYCDFERIGSKRIGSDGDLVFLRYLYKCENFPVVWYFTFYRTPYRGGMDLSPESGGTWRVITVRFDTELELLTLEDW